MAGWLRQAVPGARWTPGHSEAARVGAGGLLSWVVSQFGGATWLIPGVPNVPLRVRVCELFFCVKHAAE